jgi:ribonuclease HI
MDTIQNIQRKIEEQAISWGEALKIGDHRTANRKNSEITKIAKIIRKDRNLGEMILVPLLKHTNPSVRLLASVHALDLDIHIKEAEGTLTQIAGDTNNHVIQLMAQINLQKWKKNRFQDRS